MHTTPMPPLAGGPLLWGVVELLGHLRVAGAISEHVVAGATLLRVDVPEVQLIDRRFDPMENRWANVPGPTLPAHTRSFSTAVLYSISWCDEAAARESARRLAHKPPTDPQGVLRSAMATVRGEQPADDTAAGGPL